MGYWTGVRQTDIDTNAPFDFKHPNPRIEVLNGGPKKAT